MTAPAATRFHKAAVEGCIDVLKNGTKRDMNAVDEDGMTPVHLAAVYGNLEALRIIIRKRVNYRGFWRALRLDGNSMIV